MLNPEDYPFAAAISYNLRNQYCLGLFYRIHMGTEKHSHNQPPYEGIMCIGCPLEENFLAISQIIEEEAENLQTNLTGGAGTKLLKELAHHLETSLENANTSYQRTTRYAKTITDLDPGNTKISIILKTQRPQQPSQVRTICEIPGSGSDEEFQEIFSKILTVSFKDCAHRIRKRIHENNPNARDIPDPVHTA